MKQWEPSLFFKVVRLVLRVQIILGLILFCYNYFFQNYLGVVIVLYIGWFVGLAGLAFFILGSYELKRKGRAQKGESFLLTTILIDSGVYSVIRHPQNLGSILLTVGSILISQHWLTLILGIPLLAWFIVYVLPREDRHLIKKFGYAYEQYIQNVPSLNFPVGIVRYIHRRKRGCL